MYTAAEIYMSPIHLLEMAKANGKAEIEYEDEAIAKHFYQRLRQLNLGRGSVYQCSVLREGNVVRAINDPKQLPKAKVR